jgi:hypothetical protein
VAERQVVFYECQSFDNESAFDRLAAVVGIGDLGDDEWRVPDGTRDSDLAVLVDVPGTESAATCLRFLRIRADTVFKLSAARDLQPVDIDQDESITEFTWLVIWPDNFMAGVSLRDAPGHKKLGYYLYNTSDQATHIVNLFRPDLAQRLKAMRTKGLRQVQVKVQTSHLRQIEADKKVRGFRQIFNAGKGTDAATIGIVLSVGRGHPDAVLNDDIAEGAEQLAEYIDLVESLSIKGRNQDGEIETINMKHERIKGSIEIETSDSNNSIYRAIQRTRRTVERGIGSLDQAARGA